jgi:hypothetical protein
MLRRIVFLSFAAVFVIALSNVPAYADDGDRVHFGKSITVEEGEDAGDLVCIGCSIRVDGTSGDTVAIGGSITVEGDVKGDAVAIGGAIRLGENASVGGDVVTVGGRLQRHPSTTVKGQVSAQSGSLILIGLVLMPLVPVVLIVALIVWLVSRDRRTAQPRPLAR